MELSAPVHFDAYVAVKVLDEDWLDATLPIEEVDVPPETIAPADEDDVVPNDDDDDSDRWNDVNMPASPPRQQ